MHGSERVVGNHPAQREQIARAQDALRRHAGLVSRQPQAADRDVLHVGAAAFGDEERHIDGAIGRDEDVTTDQPVADGGHDQCVRAGRDVDDLERALRVGERLLSGGLHLDQHRGERRTGARVDDVAGYGPRVPERRATRSRPREARTFGGRDPDRWGCRRPRPKIRFSEPETARRELIDER